MKDAVPYVGWARVTYGPYGDYLFWESFFSPNEGNFGPGLALLTAKKKMTPTSDQLYRKVYSSWHLLGDPEIPIWTGSPKKLSLSYPSKVWIGPIEKMTREEWI